MSKMSITHESLRNASAGNEKFVTITIVTDRGELVYNEDVDAAIFAAHAYKSDDGEISGGALSTGASAEIMSGVVAGMFKSVMTTVEKQNFPFSEVQAAARCFGLSVSRTPAGILKSLKFWD